MKTYKDFPYTIYPWMWEEELELSEIMMYAIVYKITLEKQGYHRPARYIMDLMHISYFTVWKNFKKLVSLGYIRKETVNHNRVIYYANIRKDCEI